MGAIAAGHVGTTVVAAFAVGLVSFISPCVLPLVPGYLSAISGVSFAELSEGRRRADVLGPSLLFCLSFGVMFVALGMTATGLGQTLSDNRDLLRQVAGVLIALMGVLFIGTLFVPLLNREWRPEALLKRAHTGGPDPPSERSSPPRAPSRPSAGAASSSPSMRPASRCRLSSARSPSHG